MGVIILTYSAELAEAYGKTVTINFELDTMSRSLSLAAVFAAFLAPTAQATVQITQFNPALSISAIADLPPHFPIATTNLPSMPLFSVLPTDFNLDGVVDFRLVYGLGTIKAVFGAPTSFAVRTTPPSQIIPTGPVAAVGFGTTIGERIVSPVATNHYAWSEGATNQDESTLIYGEREAIVLAASVIPLVNAAPTMGQDPEPRSEIPAGLGGGEDGVIAVKFYIFGLPHYGYIQFHSWPNGNSLGGEGVIIRGWAYETDAEVAIVARPINETSPVPVPFGEESR
jgi:hypothetical protein